MSGSLTDCAKMQKQNPMQRRSFCFSYMIPMHHVKFSFSKCVQINWKWQERKRYQYQKIDVRSDNITQNPQLVLHIFISSISSMYFVLLLALFSDVQALTNTRFRTGTNCQIARSIYRWMWTFAQIFYFLNTMNLNWIGHVLSCSFAFAVPIFCVHDFSC